MCIVHGLKSILFCRILFLFLSYLAIARGLNEAQFQVR
jgi:hypothetical protein